jgi:hypothetical protein
MQDWIGEWVQEGRLYVWRYADARRGWRGWQWTGDAAGCRSLRNLLDRMHGGEARHRTLRLEPVTNRVLDIPNAGFRVAGQFAKLRIEYRPGADALQLEPNDGALILTVGPGRLRKLTAALNEIEIGLGDLGIETGEPKADPWLFWWTPAIED